MEKELNNITTQQRRARNSKYNNISYDLRKTLIKMVQENGFSIYKTAKILNMKHSTAKAILRKYRKQGHIFKRKHENPNDDLQLLSHSQQLSQNEIQKEHKQQEVKAMHQSEERQTLQLNSQQQYTFCQNYNIYYWYVTIPWVEQQSLSQQIRFI